MPAVATQCGLKVTYGNDLSPMQGRSVSYCAAIDARQASVLMHKLCYTKIEVFARELAYKRRVHCGRMTRPC